MKITIRFIGRYKDIIGKNTIDVVVTTGDTIWNVIDTIIQQYPALEKDKKFMMISKNNCFVNRDTKIASGDLLTLAPPVVSGG